MYIIFSCEQIPVRLSSIMNGSFVFIYAQQLCIFSPTKGRENIETFLQIVRPTNTPYKHNKQQALTASTKRKCTPKLKHIHAYLVLTASSQHTTSVSTSKWVLFLALRLVLLLGKRGEAFPILELETLGKLNRQLQDAVLSTFGTTLAPTNTPLPPETRTHHLPPFPLLSLSLGLCMDAALHVDVGVIESDSVFLLLPCVLI